MIQVVAVNKDGYQVLVGDPDCNEDPCDLHGVCHCKCVCEPDGEDNCQACRDQFGE